MAADVSNIFSNGDELIKIIQMRMPYGKYKGWYILDLPERYVVWYHQKGFPAGKLGEMLGVVYEIKLNGLEDMMRPLCMKYR